MVFIPGVVLQLLLLPRVYSLLFGGPVVPCPKPAQNCLKDVFNRVLENLGCLGCQMGCQPGYTMTSNYKYFTEPDNPGGHYFFNGVPVSSTVNVSEPQWLCLRGDGCRDGFYSTKLNDQEACSWCGKGCASCTSFNNCDRCFSGFSLNPHTLPGGETAEMCTHSHVPCPSAPNNCLHDTFVAAGIGCTGCQSCADGYMVTYNPRYMNLSSGRLAGTYDYMGLQINHVVDVNEPRFHCVAGDTCREGWYQAFMGDTLICAECSEGCAQCSSRTGCTK
ncbi:hypothetical protein V1264_023289 [Littorina saxatilis]|uniref:Uncharacterized protein n=1 Tax=Littorina saxatilis TaxID=31220 RepID=A0AAN9BB25_9CAEN